MPDFILHAAITFIIGLILYCWVRINQSKRNRKCRTKENENTFLLVWWKLIGENLLIWIASVMMIIGFIAGGIGLIIIAITI